MDEMRIFNPQNLNNYFAQLVGLLDMAPRPGTARPRDIDFSAVGKAGRYAYPSKPHRG
jgi:hypothetical protein